MLPNMHLFLYVSVCLACTVYGRRVQGISAYDAFPSLRRVALTDQSESGLEESQAPLNEFSRLLLAINTAPGRRVHGIQQQHGQTKPNRHIFHRSPVMAIPPVPPWVVRTALTGTPTAASTYAAIRQTRKRRRADEKLAKVTQQLNKTEEEKKKLSQSFIASEKRLEAKTRENLGLNRKVKEAVEVKERTEQRLVMKRRLWLKEIEAARKASEKSEQVAKEHKAKGKAESDKLKALEKQFATAAEALKKSEADAKESEEKSKSDLDKLQSLENQLATAQIALEESEEVAQNSNAKGGSEFNKVKDLERKLAVAAEALKKSEVDAKKSEAKSKSDSDKLQSLEKQLAAAAEALKKSEVDAKKSEAKSKSDSDKLQSLEKQLATAAEALKKSEADAKNSESDKLQSLEKQLATATEALKKSEADAKESEAKRKSDSVKLLSLEKQLATAQKALEGDSEFDKVKDLEKQLATAVEALNKSKEDAKESQANASLASTLSNEMRTEIEVLKKNLTESKAKVVADAQEDLKSLSAMLDDQIAALESKLSESEKNWTRFDEYSQKKRDEVIANFSSFAGLAKAEARISDLNHRRATLMEQLAKLEAEKPEEGMAGWFREKQLEWEINDVNSSLTSVQRQLDLPELSENKLSELRNATAADALAKEVAMNETEGRLAEDEQKLDQEIAYSREELAKGQAEASDLKRKKEVVAALVLEPPSTTRRYSR